ncbi:MAG TPA: polysaccharide deacetylase family protein [Bacteroidia bacterium]|jgi:peptidoglycan/xylan/chitin deacetylase (PgdA/CDA1 family)|nr:polysaccharide deacetylase family protein [Bacteroidia bacterium]
MNLFYKIKRVFANQLIQKRIPVNLSHPIISFCFDDIPNSAITNGSRILNKYGFAGTYYICMGLSDNNDPNKPYFDHSLLKQLVENGEELACHTSDHITLYNTGRQKVLRNLRKNQQKINELIPGYKFKNFSYPRGQQTFRSKYILKKEYQSARGVQAGMHVKDMDIYNLHANELMGDWTMEEVLAMIDKAIEQNAWLIFYTHEVEKNPTPYGCTPENFEQIVKYCADKKLNVLTIDKAINTILMNSNQN